MRAATLLIELGAIFFALGVLGRVASWLNIPVMPLYLVGGLAFGQGGLVSLLGEPGVRPGSPPRSA